MARGCTGARCARRPAARCAPGYRRLVAFGRTAPPRRARPAAGRRVGGGRPRRAHEPPRRGGHRLARGPPGTALGAQLRRTAARDARPVVPRRGLHAHVGGPRRRGRPLRRRVCGLRPAAGRAAAPVESRRDQAPQHPAQGARVAAPRSARAHRQAEVPDRGRHSAHRGRAAAARQRRTRQARHRAAGQGRRRPARRRGRLRRRTGAERHRVAHRTGRAHRHSGT